VIRLPLALLVALGGCAEAPAPANSEAAAKQEPPVQAARVVREYPHDARAFTQGLLWVDGKLYESTGLEGQSTIREVELETGRVLRSVALAPDLFGEGLTHWGDELISLTWRNGIGFRWNRGSLRQTGSWSYPGEGWGLTQDGREIVMSDGTAQLRFLDPATLAERRRITVTSAGRPLGQLNELEYVNGEILANVWQTPMIARIDPATGAVRGWIDLSPLVRANMGAEADVLNGIAWDSAGRRLFVTGKNWPRLYEIELPALP
jgi:glutamine cyclotransferase